MDFSTDQRKIIESDSKRIVVTAGAGSGKTTVLVEHALFLIDNEKISNKVLMLTFSNKAARDLNKKAEERISENQDRLYIGTTHQFCLDLIINYGNTIGLPPNIQLFESPEDRLDVFRKAIESFPEIKEKYESSQNYSKMLKEDFDKMSIARRNFKDDVNDLMYPVYQEYRDILLSQGAIDFDDILYFAYRILNEYESVRRIYQRTYGAVCVDEAQDLNYSQYEIIKKLCKNDTQLMLVGDPNQAIYGFNGSSPKYMCESFKEDYEVVAEFALSDNYRSSKKILAAAKKIEPDFKLTGNVPLDGEFEITKYSDEDEEATNVAIKIEELLSNGHPDIDDLKPEDICIIARNRYVLDNIQSALENRRLDYFVKQQTTGFTSETSFFNAFSLGLRLMINNRDEFHFSKIKEILKCGEELSIEDILHGNSNCIFNGYDTLVEAWKELESQEKMQQFNMSKLEKILDKFCCKESNFEDKSEKYLINKDYELWKKRWKLYIESTTVVERNVSGLLRNASMGTLNNVVEK